MRYDAAAHEARMESMINRYQFILSHDPDPFVQSTTVTKETLIRGTTINKLCEYNAGGFKRVSEWIDEKIQEINEKKNTKTIEDYSTEEIAKLSESLAKNKDEEIFKEKLDECFKLMQGRNAKYGTSWKVLSIQSIANLVEMKMNRIAKLGTDTKTEDEFKDAVNYAIFGLLKLQQNDT